MICCSKWPHLLGLLLALLLDNSLCCGDILPDLLRVKTSSLPFPQREAFPRGVLGQDPCEAQCIQALSGQMGPKESYHEGHGASLWHLLCKNHRQEGQVQFRLPPLFFGRWLTGSLVERHLSHLDSNHLTLHPHCCPFVFLQELQEMGG